MKKVLNLSVILAVLVAAFSFTSCGEDDAEVNLSLNSTSFAEGVPVTGTITSDNKVETVKIEKEDADGIYQPYKTIQSSNFGAASGVVDADGSYLLSIAGIEDGTYTIQAIDKDGNESKKVKFTVGTPGPQPITFEVELGGSESSTAGSFLSIKDQKAYMSSATAAQLGNVEIVFDGTTFKSAKESANTTVKNNGNSAVITGSGNNYTYTTAPDGYTGTITITDEDGSGAKRNVTVTVTKL